MDLARRLSNGARGGITGKFAHHRARTVMRIRDQVSAVESKMERTETPPNTFTLRVTIGE